MREQEDEKYPTQLSKQVEYRETGGGCGDLAPLDTFKRLTPVY